MEGGELSWDFVTTTLMKIWVLNSSYPFKLINETKMWSLTGILGTWLKQTQKPFFEEIIQDIHMWIQLSMSSQTKITKPAKKQSNI